MERVYETNSNELGRRNRVVKRDVVVEDVSGQRHKATAGWPHEREPVRLTWTSGCGPCGCSATLVSRLLPSLEPHRNIKPSLADLDRQGDGRK